MTHKNDLALAQQAAEKFPGSIDCWIDLCEIAERLCDYAEVLRAGDAIVKLAPNKPQPHFIRGLALQNLDRMEQALEAYRRVIALHPEYLDAWINIGHCEQALNHLEEAEKACRRVILLSRQEIAGEGQRSVDISEYGLHHWNLAIIELLKGDLKNGFARYPSRFKAITKKKRPNFSQPLWQGEDLHGKTILITVDQGFGDTLMMARYLPLLRQRGAKVILQAQKPLVPLLGNWSGIDEIVEHGAPLPPFDTHAWEFDLPRLFGTTLETIPASMPYLPLPAPDEITKFGILARPPLRGGVGVKGDTNTQVGHSLNPPPNLPPRGEEPKVGVAWAGSPGHGNDHRRSIPLSQFKELFALSGVNFFSLIRDMRPIDEEQLKQLAVVDLRHQLIDFSVTARFIQQLDLVITCDTSIAHLAGGMGKPVWVLLPFAPSWHWMMDREDSPWYPTARLFRQKARGDWAEVISRVAKALEER